MVKLLVSSCNSLLTSLNPSSPLRKGFALIRVNGKLIKNNISLKKINDIEIIRQNETALAAIKSVKKGADIRPSNYGLFEQISDEIFQDDSNENEI